MPKEAKIGLMAFSTKTAEAEPWLVEHAFVAPPDFEFLKSNHSTIMYGDTGSGKTGIRIALEQYANLQPRRLVVHWHLSLNENQVEASTGLAMAQLVEVLNACAQTLIEKLANDPAILKGASRSTQEFLVWFIKHYILENSKNVNPDNDFSAISDPVSDLIKDIISRPNRDFFSEDPSPIVIAIELAKALESAGFKGIWVILDSINWQTNAQRNVLVNSLTSVLSTLRLFEIPSFSFKFMLPMEFETELADAVAITRDRIMVFRLSWDVRYLSVMIERRFRAAMGDSSLTLDDVYNPNEVFAWLEGCGGLSPRGWLEYIRPIFSTYWDVVLSTGKKRRLTKSEWSTARSRSSLQLKFIPETNHVKIGMGMPRTLSSEIAAIFSYLYNNQGKYCTKQELYHKAYVPFIFPQESTNLLGEQSVLPKDYEDLINTAIYRLRQTIEPIPSAPVFITTKRDLGYRLSMQAFQ